MCMTCLRGRHHPGLSYSPGFVFALTARFPPLGPQPSLSGVGARVGVVCNVTPAAAQSEETSNTLKFAARAKLVQASRRGQHSTGWALRILVFRTGAGGAPEVRGCGSAAAPGGALVAWGVVTSQLLFV
jgi:hypothetical protein